MANQRQISRRNNSISNPLGFTLLEVLVAVALLVGGIIVVSTAWSGNFLRIRKSNLYNNVSVLLEKKTNELIAEFKGKPISEVTDREGDFGSELSSYRWAFSVQEFQMPDLSAILVNQKEGSKDETFLSMIKQTQEFISKSVKEGTVTVFVKTGKKEIPFSVTTYFVDYTQELSLPGMGPTSGAGTTPGSGTGAPK